MTIPQQSSILEFETEDESFLQRETDVKKINQGNSVTGAAITREINELDKWFTTFEPAPSSIEKADGKYVVGWAFSLNPGEEFTINQVTNYQLGALILLILVIILAVLYFYTRQKIIVTKKMITLNRGKEGISDVKVILTLRNRGGTIHGLRVMDKVPAFANLSKEFGTVKPSGLKKAGRDMVIIWNVDKFSRGEEILLSYTVKCKLNIIGKFLLPKAVVLYKKNRRTIRYYSKPISLVSNNIR